MGNVFRPCAVIARGWEISKMSPSRRKRRRLKVPIFPWKHVNPTMSGNVPLERCFKEAEETGRLNLSLKNLRDFPDPTEDCELIDVIEIGELSFYKLQILNLCRSKVQVFSLPSGHSVWVLTILLLPVNLADLSRNKLSEFPAELCDFVMIEKVDLYHNAIRGVPESQMSELKFLRVLNLRWVVLTVAENHLC